MRLSSRQRWLLYALAAALTAAAMVWDQRPEPAGVVHAVARSAQTSPGREDQTTAAPTPLTLAQRLPAAPQADPFAPLDAAPPVAAAVSANRAATAVPPAPVAPPLPFSYLGRWQEDGRAAVFLWRGDRSFKVSGPGPLDAEYAVESLDKRHLVLRYLPLNELQQLSFDAPAPAPPAPDVRPAPPADDTPAEDN